MKKLLVALLGFWSISASGQAALLVLIFGDRVASEKFHLSLDVGLNTPILYGLDEPVFPGVHFGLGTHLRIGDQWTLTVEFKPLNTFKVKEAPRITDLPSSLSSGFEKDQNAWNGNTIQVPIFVQYQLDRRWGFGSGPEFSFLSKMNQSYKATITGSDQTVEIADDIQPFFKNVYYNWMVDINFTLYKEEKKAAIIRVRYIQGLTSIFEEGVTTQLGEPRVIQSHLGNFQLILTIPFIE